MWRGIVVIMRSGGIHSAAEVTIEKTPPAHGVVRVVAISAFHMAIVQAAPQTDLARGGLGLDEILAALGHGPGVEAQGADIVLHRKSKVGCPAGTASGIKQISAYLRKT